MQGGVHDRRVRGVGRAVGGLRVDAGTHLRPGYRCAGDPPERGAVTQPGVGQPRVDLVGGYGRVAGACGRPGELRNGLGVDDAAGSAQGPVFRRGRAGVQPEPPGGRFHRQPQHGHVVLFYDQRRDEPDVVHDADVPLAHLGRGGQRGVDVGGAGQHGQAVHDMVGKPRQGRRRKLDFPLGSRAGQLAAEHRGAAGVAESVTDRRRGLGP